MQLNTEIKTSTYRQTDGRPLAFTERTWEKLLCALATYVQVTVAIVVNGRLSRIGIPTMQAHAVRDNAQYKLDNKDGTGVLVLLMPLFSDVGFRQSDPFICFKNH